MLGLNNEAISDLAFPTLFKKTSTGAVEEWTISVTDNVIKTVHGQFNGKKQESCDTLREGVNAGKSNATTPAQQALKEARAKWEKQRKKGYVQLYADAVAGVVEDVIEGGIAPMLAPSGLYPKFAHKLQWPVFTQPKLDGMRCIAILEDGKCTLWSRTRKRIRSMVHIERQIESLWPFIQSIQSMARETEVGASMCVNTDGRMRAIFDGELFKTGVPFEDVLSWIRTYEPGPRSREIEYHVYDFPTRPERVFSERHHALQVISTRFQRADTQSLFLVRTPVAASPKDLDEQHEENLADLNEGTMIRNGGGSYECGKRSYHLQKHKDMKDGEYLIVGADEGRGKDAGTVGSFRCRTADGKEFSARLKATYERRRELFEHPEQWRGWKLTIIYQNLTADGIPRFPIGKGLRKGSE